MATHWMTALKQWLRPLRRVMWFGLATVLIFNLAACSGATTGSARDAARTAVNVAKTAADLTGNESLKAALDPVLKVLNTTASQVKADNISAATNSLKSFQGLWDTAQPVVKLVAGSNYGLIDKGVKLLTTTFGGDTAPTKDNALAAVNGLIGPLTKLLG
jgi:hypothetical protein